MDQWVILDWIGGRLHYRLEKSAWMVDRMGKVRDLAGVYQFVENSLQPDD